MILHKKTIKHSLAWLLVAAMVTGVGCKKGTFDINSPNPNSLSPGGVPAKYYLTSSLAATATLMYNGANASTVGPDILNTWMGYWSASGGFTPSPTIVLYQLTNGTGSSNWDDAYLNLKNYNLIQQVSATDPTQINYEAISLIMQAFVYQRLVDLYNNVPYSEALNSTLTTTPVYDAGSDVYMKNIAHIDSAIGLINAADVNAEDPKTYDVMFGGDMSLWKKFANTLKLKMLMRLTQTASGPATATTELAGLTPDDFLAEGENASINPGYSTASNAQENPYYLDVAFTITGSAGTNYNYWRANSYAVKFYTNNNDPRLNYFYVPTSATGAVVGRDIGSTSGTEGNSNISAVNGAGTAYDPGQDAVVIGAFESLFLQAEAAQRGFITADPAALYKSAVEQSFVLLKVPNAVDTADQYISQADNLTNYATSGDKLRTLITQKWAACNGLDPLESYSDWRRLGIPTDLPVSQYPGANSPHIPYRLLYPTSETSYNAANEGAQGSIDIFNSKIFWQPQ